MRPPVHTPRRIRKRTIKWLLKFRPTRPERAEAPSPGHRPG